MNTERIIKTYNTYKRYWNKLWTLNSTNNIGSCVYLYGKYQPKTVEEFYEAYINDAGNDKTHGRSLEQLTKLAQQFSKQIGHDNVQDCLDFIIYKIIIDTFNGCKREQEVMDWFTYYGGEVSKASEYEDRVLGVDIWVKYKGKKYGIQIKPISFIIGNNNESLIRDRKKALKRDVFFIFYYNDGSYLKDANHKNQIFWRLKQFINTDGYAYH